MRFSRWQWANRPDRPKEVTRNIVRKKVPFCVCCVLLYSLCQMSLNVYYNTIYIEKKKCSASRLLPWSALYRREFALLSVWWLCGRWFDRTLWRMRTKVLYDCRPLFTPSDTMCTHFDTDDHSSHALTGCDQSFSFRIRTHCQWYSTSVYNWVIICTYLLCIKMHWRSSSMCGKYANSIETECVCGTEHWTWFRMRVSNVNCTDDGGTSAK